MNNKINRINIPPSFPNQRIIFQHTALVGGLKHVQQLRASQRINNFSDLLCSDYSVSTLNPLTVKQSCISLLLFKIFCLHASEILILNISLLLTNEKTINMISLSQSLFHILHFSFPQIFSDLYILMHMFKMSIFQRVLVKPYLLIYIFGLFSNYVYLTNQTQQLNNQKIIYKHEQTSHIYTQINDSQQSINQIDNTMNINQNYNQMPSQIYDSFFQTNNQQTHNYQYQSQLIHDSQSIHNHNNHNNNHNNNNNNNNNNRLINLDSSIQDDTFLGNIDIIFQNKHQKTGSIKTNKYIECSIQQLTKIILPNQTIKQSIEIINICAEIIKVKVQSSPFVMSCRGKQNIKEIYMEAYQRLDLDFVIKKDMEELGDIYDTIIIQSGTVEGLEMVKEYIPVQVKYVTPSICVKYMGCSQVVSVMAQNKVSANRIGKNKFGEYQMHLQVNTGVSGQSIPRFQCNLETRGQISVFPNQLIFYEGEARTIYIREKKKNHGLGVLILRNLNAKINYVIGVQLL